MYRFLQSVLSPRVRQASRKPPRRSFRPEIETLEGRECPSVSIALDPANPSILRITGDGADNFVSILQNDAINDLSVSVVSPGGATHHFNSGQIKTIVAKLGGGSDKFRYDLAGGDFTNQKTIKLDLGAGAEDRAWFHLHDDDTSSSMPTIKAKLDIQVGLMDSADNTGKDVVYLNLGNVADAPVSVAAKLGAGEDEFYAAFWGASVSGAAKVSLDVKGGGGKDVLKAGGEEYIVPHAESPGTVLIGTDAAVDIQLDGGGDADTLGVSYEGQLWGKLTISALGGVGNDQVSGQVEAKDLYLFGSTIKSNGYLDAVFSGQEDNDGVNLWLGGSLSQLHVINALINGGTGSDYWREKWTNGNPAPYVKVEGTTTPNVTKVNMEGFVVV